MNLVNKFYIDFLKIKFKDEGPHSIFLRTGSFYTAPSKKKYSKFEYDRLRENHTAKELYMRGTKVGVIAQLYEQKYRENYIENLIDLIKNDESKSSKFSRLANLYYPYLSKPSKFVKRMIKALSFFSEEDEQRFRRYEDDLVKTGIERSILTEYVLSLAEKSPDCLSRISIEFETAKRNESPFIDRL